MTCPPGLCPVLWLGIESLERGHHGQKAVIMARKRYSAEQIIGHLRQAEILISEGDLRPWR